MQQWKDSFFNQDVQFSTYVTTGEDIRVGNVLR